MFCSLCPLSVRQLIDRINLALTDQSIYPTRKHLVDIDSKWSSSGLLLYGSYFTTSSIEKKYRPVKEEPEKSSWLSTGYSQSLPWLCPKLRAQHLGGSDSPIWFFFATATAVAKCMIITHNMMLTWWKNPWSIHIQLRQAGPSSLSRSRPSPWRTLCITSSHPKSWIDHEILLCQWLFKKEENPNVWKQHLNKNLSKSSI